MITVVLPMNTPDSYINIGCDFHQNSDVICTDGLMNHVQPQPIIITRTYCTNLTDVFLSN